MKQSLKKLMYGAILALPCTTFAQSFTENFGSVSSTSTIAQASPFFVNPSFTWSGTADVRNTAPSTTASATGYASASGNSNFFITNTVGKYFQVEGINTSALTSPGLTFGVSKSVNASNGSDLALEISTDGITYTALSFATLPTGTGTSHWYQRSAIGTIPSTTNLRIRFKNTGVTTQYRIDDVVLGAGSSTTTCTASITAGGATTFCNGGNVLLTATSGASYLWSNGATTQTVLANQSATYNVTVTAVGGCTAVSAPVRVLAYPSPTVGVSATDVCGGANATLTARAFATDLFFSEYVEGSSNEKYIEIYNGTGSAVNLSNYIYKAYHNGTVTPTFVDTLSGTLNDGDVLVLKNNAAGFYAGGIATFAVAHNGNDALALYNITTAANVDIFGVIGVDPVSAWLGTTTGYTTLDRTLRRKSSVYSGITVNPALPGQSGFTTLVSEWDVFFTDDVSGLGAHTMNGTYSWISGTTPSTGNIVTANPSVPTVYTVNGDFAVSGCSSSATVQVNISEGISALIDSDADLVTLCYGQQCANFGAVPLGGTAPFTYAWSTGSTGEFATVCPTVSASYTLTVTDAHGCTTSTTTNVDVINACCSGTNVIVCTGTETLCVDSSAVAGMEGVTVGPCAMEGGRLSAPAAKTAAIRNNTTVSNVYPNPFAETATLEVKLAENSNVKIEIMDYTGKKIAELNNSALTAGTHTFNWNGTNGAGNSVATGLYLCRISSGANVQTIKIQKSSDK